MLDFLLELFIEVFGEGFLALNTSLFSKKSQGKKGRRAARILAAVITLFLLGGLLVGIAVLIESGGQSLWAWLVVLFVILYTVISLVAWLRRR